MTTENSALAQAIADHVLRILSCQDQLKACQKEIKDLQDSLSDKRQYERELQTHIQDLTDTLNYSLTHSQDPTQVMLTRSHEEIATAAHKPKKSSKTHEHVDYLREMLAPTYNDIVADWSKLYISKETW